MVFEQVLTVLFAIGVGAAIVVYATRPRHSGASISAGPSAVGSFAPAEIVQAESMPQVTAIETPVVETSSPEVQTFTEVAPVVADVAAAGPIEVASFATPVVEPSSATPASMAETVEAPATVAASKPRAQRKRSTTTRRRAKSTPKTTTS